MIAFDVDASQINFPNGNVDYSKLNDQVVAIDPYNMTVTLNLINGFSFGRPVWYLSMDASISLAAAIEHNTYAPLVGKLLLGDDDTFGFPPRGPIYHLTLLHQLSNRSASLLNDERACRFSHQNRRAFQHSQPRAVAHGKPCLDPRLSSECLLLAESKRFQLTSQ
jgi:hypothetical protein